MRVCFDFYIADGSGRRFRKIFHLPLLPVEGTRISLFVNKAYRRFSVYQTEICELPGTDNWQYIVYLEALRTKHGSEVQDPPPDFDADPTWSTI